MFFARILFCFYCSKDNFVSIITMSEYCWILLLDVVKFNITHTVCYLQLRNVRGVPKHLLQLVITLSSQAEMWAM